MRDEASVQAMLDRFDAAGEDVDIEVDAVRETLLWVVHTYLDDDTVLTYLPCGDEEE